MMIPERWPPLPVYQDTTVIETEPDHPILTKRYPEKAISFIKNSFLVIALLIASPGFAQQKTPNGKSLIRLQENSRTAFA